MSRQSTHDSRYAAKHHINETNKILLLPTEVRHNIYGYLFHKSKVPIWLVSHYQLFQPLYSVPTTRNDPILETQLFRCCKDLYKDAASFAYRVNVFELRGDLTAFCGLSHLALSSISTLSVVQAPWKAGPLEDKAWVLLQTACRGLKSLEIVLQQDTLLSCLPFLAGLRHGQANQRQMPSLVLDVYVWDRHFSFDPLYRDLAWSESVIQGSMQQSSANSLSRARMLGLPRYPQQIVLSADITAGAVEAIDRYLASTPGQSCTKASKEPPQHGPRAVGGRSTRFWYQLGSAHEH